MANTIQIGADTSGFVSGINRAQGSMAGLGSMIQRVVGGAAVFSGLTAAAKGFFAAIQAGDDLVDLNAQTGVAIDKLMELQLAFDLNGMKAEQVQPVLSKMQRMIADAGSGSAEAAAKFAMMGISIGEIQGLNADEQLMKIGEAISEIQNPAQRSAMAMEIFGKSGAKLLSVFAAGGMEEVKKMLGNQSALLLQNAGIFGRASDILGLTGNKIRGFFVGISSEIVPDLMAVLDKAAQLDFSKVGQAAGSNMSFLINYFQTFGSQGDLIYNTMKLAFMGAVNFLHEELSVVLAVTAASFKNIFKGQTAQENAIKQAEIVTRAKSPLLDTTKTEQKIQSDLDAIEESKQANAADARRKYGTPGASPTGLDILQKAGGEGGPAAMIATSGAKVGALGGAVWGGEQSINVQRDQLAVQQRIANSIDAFLKAVTPTSNPYIGGVTPQLGVI